MNRRHAVFVSAAFAIALPLTLSGCGNKGPLVLPDASAPAAVQPAAEPALQPAVEPAADAPTPATTPPADTATSPPPPADGAPAR